jgi:hypothetical protein
VKARAGGKTREILINGRRTTTNQLPLQAISPDRLLAELRQRQERLFAGDPDSKEGLLVAQVRLSLLRASRGILVRRDEMLQVLDYLHRPKEG